MDASDPKAERLTEFERAVCYDTLPQFTRPLTVGIVFTYSALLIGAFLVLAYGVRQDMPQWRFWGAGAVAIVICVGILGFLYRALYYAIRQRDALLSAQSMPNVESGFDELPDPFDSHTLLRYYRTNRNEPKLITGNRGEPAYAGVPTGNHGWEVQNPAGELAFRVEPSRPPRSFSFDWGVPSEYHVARDGQLLAVIERPFTLGRGRVEIRAQQPQNRLLIFRDGGLFDGETLVGRIYALRNYLYLDIRRAYLDDGVLGFFVCML